MPESSFGSCPVRDVFGIILESPADTEDIGQYLEKIVKDVDYISPMVYPSHYAVGQIVNGVQFMKPDLDPYGVCIKVLLSAITDWHRWKATKPM